MYRHNKITASFDRSCKIKLHSKAFVENFPHVGHQWGKLWSRWAERLYCTNIPRIGQWETYVHTSL